MLGYRKPITSSLYSDYKTVKALRRVFVIDSSIFLLRWPAAGILWRALGKHVDCEVHEHPHFGRHLSCG